MLVATETVILDLAAVEVPQEVMQPDTAGLSGYVSVVHFKTQAQITMHDEGLPQMASVQRFYNTMCVYICINVYMCVYIKICKKYVYK